MSKDPTEKKIKKSKKSVNPNSVKANKLANKSKTAKPKRIKSRKNAVGGSGTKQSQFSKAQVEQALRAAYGIKAQAAAMLIQKNGKSLSRPALELLIVKYNLDDVIRECSESFVDLAEVAIAKKIQRGDTTSIVFTLKTRGKARGWKEDARNQITVNNTQAQLENLMDDNAEVD